MYTRKKRTWVTLLELMIVMGIISILSVILFRTYGTVAELAFRIEQQKNVTNEIVTFSQILQNYADRNQIDYSKYTGLVTSIWMTDTLYLSGEDGQFALYGSSGTLYVMRSGENISLTNPKKILFGDVQFKIIPFASQQEYLDMTWFCPQGNLMFCLNAPGFWIITQAHNTRYQSGQRANNIKIPVQEFFTLQ